MTCEILSLADFAAAGRIAIFVRNHLTKPGSDFQRKLTSLILGETTATEDDGHIAVVLDRGEPIGWARTECWSAGSDGAGGSACYDTLEAFVAEKYRLRGVAAFAASGIAAGPLYDTGAAVAVFAPHMLLVARRAGLWPVLFHKVDSQWVRA